MSINKFNVEYSGLFETYSISEFNLHIHNIFLRIYDFFHRVGWWWFKYTIMFPKINQNFMLKLFFLVRILISTHARTKLQYIIEHTFLLWVFHARRLYYIYFTILKTFVALLTKVYIFACFEISLGVFKPPSTPKYAHDSNLTNFKYV